MINFFVCVLEIKMNENEIFSQLSQDLRTWYFWGLFALSRLSNIIPWLTNFDEFILKRWNNNYEGKEMNLEGYHERLYLIYFFLVNKTCGNLYGVISVVYSILLYCIGQFNHSIYQYIFHWKICRTFDRYNHPFFIRFKNIIRIFVLSWR